MTFVSLLKAWTKRKSSIRERKALMTASTISLMVLVVFIAVCYYAGWSTLTVFEFFAIIGVLAALMALIGIQAHEIKYHSKDE